MKWRLYMINNFKIIENLITTENNDNKFYYCQIVIRNKDHNKNGFKNGVIKDYFITSKEHLNKLKNEIILLCEEFGARAYINLTEKSFERLQKLVLVKLSNDFFNGTIRNPRKCISSAAGELSSKNPKWVIDIDNMDILPDIEDFLLSLYSEHNKNNIIKENYIFAQIPTPNGCHLIVKPFNLQKFKNIYNDIDVHQNSMGTLLYYPSSISTYKPKFCCDRCGGTNIQIQAWINANTNEYVDDISGDECWCEDCQKHTKIKTI